jgi:hypothetical protein
MVLFFIVDSLDEPQKPDILKHNVNDRRTAFSADSGQVLLLGNFSGFSS